MLPSQNQQGLTMIKLKRQDSIRDKAAKTIEKMVKDLGGVTETYRYLREFNDRVMPQHVASWIKSGRIPVEYILFLQAKSKGDIKPYDLAPNLYPKKYMDQIEKIESAEFIMKMYDIK